MLIFFPTSSFYISAETPQELAELVAEQCADWERTLADVYPQSDEFYAYEFRQPSEGENNYSQRLAHCWWRRSRARRYWNDARGIRAGVSRMKTLSHTSTRMV
jgi:hypothetical protein